MDLKVAGHPHPRLESYEKVTGQAKYTGDMIFPDMAVGAILRSPHAHARILRFDKREAEKVEGLLGILLPKDVPQKRFNCSGNPPSPLLIDDERILTDHPLFAGDRIAAVVAETEDAAREALGKIKIDYEILSPIFKVKQALLENAPLVHADLSQDNIAKKLTAAQGNIEDGFKHAAFVFDDTFHTPPVQHVALEPITCVSHFTAEGKLSIWSTSQTPFQERRILSSLLDTPQSDIRIIKPVMGGGFGARQQLHNQHVAALLSKLILRPVKIVNNREEELYASAVRHESTINLKVGVTEDGLIHAFHARVFLNTGPYATHGPIVLAAAGRKLQYRVPHYLYEGYCVYTNAPVAGAMRGYGNPQITFAREVMFNRIAQKLNMDPVRFRLMNHVGVGDHFPGADSPVQSCAIEDCVRGAEIIKNDIDNNSKVTGSSTSANQNETWGVAFGCHTSGPSSKEGMSSCVLLVNDDGTVRLMTGSADIGQGSETTLCQVAAEELGLDMADITIHAADTLMTPYDTGTFASSQMYVSGNAVHQAARNLIVTLKHALCEKYTLNPDRITRKNGKIIISKTDGPLTMNFKECVAEVTFGPKGTVLIGHSSFKAKESPPPFAVCWAKVAVDHRTNAAVVTHLIEAVDVGTAVNPGIVSGQVEGGLAMGFGFAMMEEIDINHRAGKPISSDLLHYKLPLAMDMPQTHVYIAKSHEPTGPLGAKSVGELSTVPVAPAIVNAISNACNQDINRLPISKIVVPGSIRLTGPTVEPETESNTHLSDNSGTQTDTSTEDEGGHDNK